MSYGKFLFLYLVARNIGDTMTTKVFEAFKNEDVQLEPALKPYVEESPKVRKRNTATPD